jgi:16S rRNA (cytosine967-C5)-methyltransferase
MDGRISGRALMLGALRDQGVEVGAVFTGEGYAPEALTSAEAVSGTPTPDDQLDLPDWLIAEFNRSLGHDASRAARMMRQRAPIMVRANSARTDAAHLCDILVAEGISAQPHEIASTAIQVTDGARRLNQSDAYKAGLFEMQDGSSQAAMEAVPLPQTGTILDYCAGGGGKTLALAARGGAGLRWIAHDADPARMKDLTERAARAGVEVHLAQDPDDLTPPFDLVLCDVPCSGSGTWRRTPDAKWSLTPRRLEDLQQIQASILENAAALVAGGGTLVYATCSVLRQESEAQIEAFQAALPRWRSVLTRRWPVSDGGDGFFIAIMSCENR